MLFARLAETSAAVAATSSRIAKRAAIAAAVREVAAPPATPTEDGRPAEIELVVTYLSGTLRQRRTGVGWASLGDLPAPAPAPELTVRDVDAAFERIAAMGGPGSAARRSAAVASVVRPGDRGRAATAARPGVRRDPAGRAGFAGAGRPGRGVRRARRRPCSGRRCCSARPRPPPRCWRRGAGRAGGGRRCASGSRSGRCWPRARPTPPAPSPRPACRRSWTPSSTASGCRCTATATRSSGLHPQPGRHHRPGTGDRRGGRRAAARRRSCWTARCWRSVPTADR